MKKPTIPFAGFFAKQVKTEEFPQDNVIATPAVPPERKSSGPFGFLKGALAKQVKTEELSQDDVIIASVAS